ncbi:hypothetical protein [uncultured Sutterella sp.]|uniref:hypothetical protein n=1 Tax=uncultured Sutterella sp. TaxID=286133 RepID=UPI0025E5A34C|nr:hypothetical protein [uncultured Sutterella sp.]MBS5217334.1 hypothetical protein [Sutterella wadsworthensis]
MGGGYNYGLKRPRPKGLKGFAQFSDSLAPEGARTKDHESIAARQVSTAFESDFSHAGSMDQPLA